VFAIVAENCQVNGVDFAELIKQNSSMEAVNTDLVTKLQEMQAETENLLSRTIEYRRQVPQAVKEAFNKETENLLQEIEETEGKSAVELSEDDLKLCQLGEEGEQIIKPNFYSNKLSSGLSHLVQLQSVIF
jgi:RNase adaptor protein for sRNA GlmZ degradation